MSKRLSVFSIFLVLVVVLAGCAQATPTKVPAPTQAPAATKAVAPTKAPAPTKAAAKAPTEMHVWITWGDNPAQLQSLFNKYGKANGIKVIVNAPVDEDKVVAALSGSHPPDVLVLSGPDNVPTWVNEGLLTPLDDIIAANKINLNDMYAAMLAQGKYFGKYYALPWGSDTYALYWNKDLFEAAGLDPKKPPKTLEELVQYADKLTKVDKDGNIIQMGFVPDYAWSHIEQYVPMFGGYWISRDGTKVQLDSKPVIDALKWEQYFYKKYGPDKVLKFVSSQGDYASPQNGFMAGKIAMTVDGEWFMGPNFIAGLKPDLWYGVAPFPYPKAHPERANTNTVGGTVVVIPKGVANLEASGKLLAWMMTPDVIAEEMSTNYNLPSSKTAAKDPRFHKDKNFELFMKLAQDPNATTQVFTPASTEINTELGNIEEKVLHAGADPVPLLKKAQQKLQPILEKALQNK